MASAARAEVRVARVVEPTEATQQVGARGVEVLVLVEFARCGDRVGDREPGVGTVGHRHRDGAVELDHR